MSVRRNRAGWCRAGRQAIAKAWGLPRVSAKGSCIARAARHEPSLWRVCRRGEPGAGSAGGSTAQIAGWGWVDSLVLSLFDDMCILS